MEKNEINLRLNLYKSNIVAIPLKHQEGCKLNPQPNFLLVHNTFDSIRQDFPDGKGGIATDVLCRNSLLNLVYRGLVFENDEPIYIEELEFKVNGSNEVNFNQIIPKKLADVVDEGHQECIENEVIINTFLPLLRFKGMLSDFRMEYDVEKSKEYLDNKNLLQEIISKPVVYPTIPLEEPVVESPK